MQQQNPFSDVYGKWSRRVVHGPHWAFGQSLATQLYSYIMDNVDVANVAVSTLALVRNVYSRRAPNLLRRANTNLQALPVFYWMLFFQWTELFLFSSIQPSALIRISHIWIGSEIWAKTKAEIYCTLWSSRLGHCQWWYGIAIVRHDDDIICTRMFINNAQMRW